MENFMNKAIQTLPIKEIGEFCSEYPFFLPYIASFILFMIFASLYSKRNVRCHELQSDLIISKMFGKIICKILIDSLKDSQKKQKIINSRNKRVNVLNQRLIRRNKRIKNLLKNFEKKKK